MKNLFSRKWFAHASGLFTALAFFIFIPATVFGQTVTINNDIPQGELGHWSVVVQSGGESRTAYITAEREQSGDLYTENVLYDYFTYIDPGANGNGVRISNQNATNPVRDPGNPNIVSSSGFFIGENDNTIDWTVTSGIVEGDQSLTNRYTFTTRDGGPLGTLRLLQYLDEDVEAVSDDVFFTKGHVDRNSLELITMDGTEVYGVSQSGSFREEVKGLENANFTGWAADIYNNIQPRIMGSSGQQVSLNGEIQNLPEYIHSTLGNVRGPADVVSVLAWDVNEASSSATIITSLGGLPNAASALRPPHIAPPGTKTVITGSTQQAIDPSKPTIVITHGLQGDNYAEVSADGSFDELFSGFSNVRGQEGAGYLVRQQLGNSVNVIQFVWSEAFQGGWPGGYPPARPYADDAGVALAKYLVEELGILYDQPIHFIGHSLGAVANAHAARLFLTAASDVPQTQITMLDFPARSERWGLGGPSIPQGYFAILLQDIQDEKNIKIDNYYSLDTTAAGDLALGRIYNHPRLNNPNDVQDEVLTEGASNDHSGVHQWYRWTMNPNGFNGTTYCNPDGSFNDPGMFFSNSLNPCNRGWYWSLFGQGGWSHFPTNLGAPIILGDGVTLPLGAPSTTFGCTFEEGVIICHEQSSPYITFDDVAIPEGSEYISFDYRFPSIGDGDYAAILLDDEPFWTLAGDSVFNPNEFTNSGPIPLPQNIAEGTHKLTIVLFSVGEKNAVFELKNIQTNATQEHTARSLKQSVIEHLTDAKTGDRKMDRKIDRAIKRISKSLDSKLWIDDTHLQFPKGTQVFEKEAEAVALMRAMLLKDDKIAGDNHIPKRVKDKLLLPESVRHAFELAIQDLLSADRMLAETALEEAKEATLLENQWLQNQREKMLEKAEEAMQKAQDEANKKPAKAVMLYGKAWLFSNFAVKPAGKGFNDFEMDNLINTGDIFSLKN